MAKALEITQGITTMREVLLANKGEQVSFQKNYKQAVKAYVIDGNIIYLPKTLRTEANKLDKKSINDCVLNASDEPNMYWLGQVESDKSDNLLD